MHKLSTAAFLVAAFGSAGLLAAGTAHADQGGYGSSNGNGGYSIVQSTTCGSHDANVDILGQVGVGNGVGGNLLNGEGNSGAQQNSLGSTMGCNNEVGQ
ncbi:hypothetical protein AB0O67_06775 [Streptomyces sp. NPDC086077]|uniref:hypothetical protein n=1 Tax=unclassified Streptomyces TaxID=2593676 RepID=UPI003418B89A